MKGVLALFCAALLCGGCARGVKRTEEMQRPPIEVELPQSFAREGKLYVKAALRPLVNLKSDDVVVGILGLQDGEVRREEYRGLLQVSGAQLVQAGQTLMTDFEMPADGLTEYQIVVKWGADAKTAVGKLETAKPEALQRIEQIPAEPPLEAVFRLRNLTLKKIPRENCTNSPCDELFAFEGELVNGLPGEVRGVVLALGVSFVPTGAPIAHPKDLEPLKPDEQEVQLQGLTLPNGEKKRVEVKLSEPLAQVPEGAFVPYLRILRFEK